MADPVTSGINPVTIGSGKDKKEIYTATKATPTTDLKGNKTYVMEVVLRKTDNFNMYSNPYAFGVPTSTGSTDWDSLPAGRKPAGSNWPPHRGEFAPFTPPYFYGDSIARIVYKPQDSLLGSGGSSGGLQIGIYTVTLQEILADIQSSTVTGSFFAGRRASAYGTAWAPTDLGIDLRMWLNPSDTSTTTFQSGTNHLTSITDASGNSGATININNTPQQGTEDNKEIIVFDHSSNEYLSTGSFAILSWLH